MRDKRMFVLYISSSSLKKRLTHAYRLTLMSFYIKIMMENYQTCALITLNSFFFQRGNSWTPFLMIQCHIAWNWFHISNVHYLFVFTSQVSTKLSGIDFNRAKYHFKNAKSRFSNKQDWICHNTTEMIGEIDFTFVFVSI